MRKVLSFFVAITIVAMCSITGFAEETTLEISNADELMAFAAAVNNGDYNNLSDVTVKLTDDIDLSKKEWVPIGTEEHYFPGVFEGNGKTVSNLTLNLITNGSYVGFFGVNCSKTQNLKVSGTISVGSLTNYGYCGGIAGANLKEITNCQSDFSVSAAAADMKYAVCGGIVGLNLKIVSNSEATVQLNEVGNPHACYCGGIVGRLVGGEVLNCTSNGTVTIQGAPSASFFGGISGSAMLTNIVGCTNNSVFNMSAESNSVSIGGISGIADRSKVYKCRNLADATVKPTHYGGIAGQFYDSAGTAGKAVINNCYSSGNINCTSTSKDSHAGGIAGQASGDVLIKNSYSTGTITSVGITGAIAANISSADVSVVNCYFTDNAAENGAGLLSETDIALLHGLTTADIGTRKTAEEMKSQETVDALNKGGDYVYNTDGYPTFGTNAENSNTMLYLSDLTASAADINSEATMIIASYNNGVLIDVTTQQVTGHTMMKVNSDMVNMEGADQVRVFLLDGLNGIVPLCDTADENI